MALAACYRCCMHRFDNTPRTSEHITQLAGGSVAGIRVLLLVVESILVILYWTCCSLAATYCLLSTFLTLRLILLQGGTYGALTCCDTNACWENLPPTTNLKLVYFLFPWELFVLHNLRLVTRTFCLRLNAAAPSGYKDT